MSAFDTTRMSSRGQVVIPESIRRRLNLKAGAQFVVVGDNDVVILKAITAPNMDKFIDLIQQARQQAKLASLQRSEIARATSKARSRK